MTYLPILPSSHARIFLLLFATALTCGAKETVLRTEANVPVELTLHASRSYADPFNDVTLDVVFLAPKGHTERVPAFWAGGAVWKARYASPVTGVHQFRTECSEPGDSGLHHVAGRVEVAPYRGRNPLYLHGPLRVAANQRYLEHADHTPFFWLGDTWWMGLCHRLHWPDEFRQLAMDRKEKGFNVIQIVAGLYPDMPPFDPRGANEKGFPWETNYARIRPEYFDAADERIRFLVEQGLTPCIVGAWGYFMPWMGVEKMKAHWRYLIARYGALPVVWCAAGEGNRPWYLAKGFPYDDRKQVADWTEVLRFIRATDPFHRLLTIHPTAINQYTARHATDDSALLDFDMLQTPHGRAEAVPVTVNAVQASRNATPVMPVIDGEASYEMLNDSLPTEWTRRMFWLCLMNGAAGHTYGANGIWQCNRPGQPHGASPHGGSYGTIPWNEAMRLPGSRQVGLAKRFLEQFPWTRFEPHPEWVAANPAPPLSLDGCQWIWFPEGNPAQNAPAEKRFFRRTFTLPSGKTIEHAHLRVSADDWSEAWLNGKPLGVIEDWHIGRQFNHLAAFLKPGLNLLAILAENKPTSGPANPAGLIVRLEIRFTDGETLRLTSGAEWRCSRTQAADWNQPAFNDSSWPTAMVLAPFGDGPWGRLSEPDRAASTPQATGLTALRVIYVPDPEPVTVRSLAPGIRYQATCFDPVSGETTSLGPIEPDLSGLWSCPPPRGQGHDWVLVLRAGTQ
jgi:hypothetical protein